MQLLLCVNYICILLLYNTLLYFNDLRKKKNNIYIVSVARVVCEFIRLKYSVGLLHAEINVKLLQGVFQGGK